MSVTKCQTIQKGKVIARFFLATIIKHDRQQTTTTTEYMILIRFQICNRSTFSYTKPSHSVGIVDWIVVALSFYEPSLNNF